MKKIVTYIKQGKGTGLLFLLAGAVIMTLFFIIPAKEMVKDIEPKIMLVAKDFLPITIENKKITTPTDTYKKLDNGNYMLVGEPLKHSLNDGETDVDCFFDGFASATPIIIDKTNFSALNSVPKEIIL
jgi:hypothetical protein